MTYIIKATEVVDETLNTDVEYTFEDGSVELIRVSHFMPESKEVVIANIEQREVSEEAKRKAEKQNALIAEELQNLITLE